MKTVSPILVSGRRTDHHGLGLQCPTGDWPRQFICWDCGRLRRWLYFAVSEEPVGSSDSAIYISADPVFFTDLNDPTQQLKWETGIACGTKTIFDLRDIDQDDGIEVLSGGSALTDLPSFHSFCHH